MNLLESIKTKYGNSLAVHSAEFFDEEQTNTGKAVDASFAAIIAGMIQKVSKEKGARDLYKVVKAEDDRDYDIENIFTRSPQTVNGLVNRGNHFLPSIYPGKLREATNSVAAESGVTKLTSSKMMRVNTPLILGSISKHVKDNNLDADGLKSFLNSQKSSVESVLPKDFIEASEMSAFGWVKKEKVVEEKPVKVKREKVVKEKKIVEKKMPIREEVAPVDPMKARSSFWKWLLPLLAILALIWFIISRVGCGGADKVASTVTAPIEKVTQVVEETSTNVLGKVNDTALNALNSMKFAAGSVGDQMMTFIKGGAKGDGRFRFNNLNFSSGSATIDAASQVEVDNLAAILNAYTDVKVNIEGYTDSQGNAGSNLALSQRRSDAVVQKLVAAGIANNRITSKGYGAENPIADNGTPEGRAENRRIEVVIAKK